MLNCDCIFMLCGAKRDERRKGIIKPYVSSEDGIRCAEAE